MGACASRGFGCVSALAGSAYPPAPHWRSVGPKMIGGSGAEALLSPPSPRGGSSGGARATRSTRRSTSSSSGTRSSSRWSTTCGAERRWRWGGAGRRGAVRLVAGARRRGKALGDKHLAVEVDEVEVRDPLSQRRGVERAAGAARAHRAAVNVAARVVARARAVRDDDLRAVALQCVEREERRERARQVVHAREAGDDDGDGRQRVGNGRQQGRHTELGNFSVRRECAATSPKGNM